jgi:D-3-phosphoglycerate dehydrogenase
LVSANYIDLTAEIINSSPNLKYIISPAVGFDWIDVEAANKNGVKILNCPTFNTRAVAEHAIALMFAVSRQIVLANNSILEGKFDSTAFLGTEVYGKTLVCVGYGNIGSKIITLAQGLGMITDFIDSTTSDEDFDKKISTADVLVISVPLNEKTKGLINKHRISLLKPKSIVINVARGLIIDQDALYQALEQKLIYGAGIDTFPDDQTIKIANENISKFARLPNVVSTPHMAFNTVESIDRLGDEFLADIESCVSGKPINIVN